MATQEEKLVLYAELIKHKIGEDAYNKLEEIFSNYLPCTKCGAVLPDREFTIQRSYAARRSRSNRCLMCQSKERAEKKAKIEEVEATRVRRK